MNAKVSPLEKEWNDLVKKDDKFLNSRIKARTPIINEKLDPKIPPALRDTLNTAFNKAFEIIFDKGVGVIEKTFSRERYEMDYKVNEYALGLKDDKKRLKKFGKKAGRAKKINLAVSCASGIGLGAVGVGIPDIPIFTASVFKSVYETALSFGCSYDSPEERIFILRLIEIAMKQGVDFAEDNTALNKLIDAGQLPEEDMDEQKKRTAQSMTDAMIYMKFLQGMFIVGAVGGAWDVVYMNRITDYAILKYKRRFLVNRMKNAEQNNAEQYNAEQNNAERYNAEQ